MKRNQFLTLSALVAWIIGLIMMIAPERMMEGMGVAPGDVANYVLQLAGVNVFAIGWITFLSRNDAGGAALRGVMLGNILVHVLGFAFDMLGYGRGLMMISGVIVGVVIHVVLVAGFAYFLITHPRSGTA